VVAFIRAFYTNPWRCLDDRDWGTTNETPADLWRCQSLNGKPVKRQEWHFERQANGSYAIRNVYSRLCLDGHDYASHPRDGALVRQHACNGTAFQQWWLRNAGNYSGGFGGQLQNGYSKKCLEVPNYAAYDGAPVVMATCR
jgi:hypothetical protein